MRYYFIKLTIGGLLNVFQRRVDACTSVYAIRSLRRRLGAVGPTTELFPDLFIDYAERIKIGDWVHIGSGGQLFGRGGLSIADHVIIGPQVTIMTSKHNHHPARLIPYDEVELLKPVEIGVASWIGLGVILMPGVVLGKGCIVGAGSVVTKSFPDGSIVAGNPAKIIGQRDMQLFLDHLTNDRTYFKNWYLKNKGKVERMAGSQIDQQVVKKSP